MMLLVLGIILFTLGFITEDSTAFLLSIIFFFFAAISFPLPKDESDVKVEIINSFNQVQEYSTLERN